MVASKQITGAIATVVLRVVVKGLDNDPGINPVAGYVDTVAFQGKPARVIGANIMPGIPDNAMDLIAAVTLTAAKTPTSNHMVSNVEGLICCTGSAIPPIPPVEVDLFDAPEAWFASLVVYQSNASYTKTGVVAAAVHYIKEGPTIYRV